MERTVNIKYMLTAMFFCSITFTGCKKYLDEKSNQALVVPTTIEDLQSLMDTYFVMNQNDPGSSEISADNFYLQYSDWSGFDQTEQNTYVWEKANLFAPGNANDWAYLYNYVYNANLVLSNLNAINRSANDQSDWNNVKGQALFIRARSFLHAAFIWSLAYDSGSATTDMGIPLRLDPNFNTTSVRSNVQQTYDRIVQDLKLAIPLLPVTPLHVLRASKPAAYALLARTYLSMRKYDKELLYADSCLQLNNTLMDYNNKGTGIDPASQYPFSRFNPEVLFDSQIPYPYSLYYGYVDSALYDSYDANDLRKALFYPTPQIQYFNGNYEGADNLFSGIATDEVYLTRAECYARSGNKEAALADLNALMMKRWKSGTFKAFTASDAADAVNRVLAERRKELVLRGLRWMDIKRLNKEGANIVLKRMLNGRTYTLTPNDSRYALPIPEDVINISGMKQNP